MGHFTTISYCVWGTSQGILSKELGPAQEPLFLGAIYVRIAYQHVEEQPSAGNTLSSFI